MKHKKKASSSEVDQLKAQLRHTQNLVLLGLFVVGIGVFCSLFGISFG